MQVGDRTRLQEFRCARQFWYEREVEAVIKGELYEHAIAGRARGLMFLAGDTLAGMAYHSPKRWPLRVMGSKLLALGLELNYQGGTLVDGSLISDFVLRGTIRDGLEQTREGPWLALAAPENNRSAALLRRNAFREVGLSLGRSRERDEDVDYVNWVLP